MADLRARIIEAGLATLRENGYVGFTQPKVAALANLRQSHLTYYYPTRLDLISAVGRAVVDQTIAGVAATFVDLQSISQAPKAIAEIVTRHGNTRVLMALAQAADEEPAIRELFRELADGIVSHLRHFLEQVEQVENGEQAARLMHALSVGLAIVDLATGRPEGKKRATKILQHAIPAILTSATGRKPSKPRRRGERLP